MASASYQGASRSYDELKVVRVPAIGALKFRGTSAAKDQRYVNGFFDVLTDPETQKKQYFFVKKPGYTQTGGIRPPVGNATARGTYSWNGKLYSVWNNKIYSGTTDLGVTLSGSSGMCGFAETRPGVVTQYLGINDGVKLYLIATNDVVTTITVNYPTPNTTDLAYMDGYFFVLKTDGTLWNCDVDTPGTWNIAKFITTQQYNGAGVGLAHQNNIMIVFTDRATAMFYDNANSAGSPLNLYEQAVQQYGCASQNSIAADEQYVVWVSNSGNGGYAVIRMDGIGAFKPISTPPIERMLRAEGTSISACKAVNMRIAGKFFYILHLSSASRTFVYDYAEDLWVEWEAAAGGTVWPIVSVTQHLNKLIVQHTSNGWLYVMDEAVYQDDATNFTVLWRTSRVDFDTVVPKFVRMVDLVCDVQSSTANASLQYSTDDFVTLSTARTFDMSLNRCFGTQFGRHRRTSWQVSYSGNTPCRWEALEFRLRLGQQ